MNTISHANHLGERRAATQPEPFDHSKLYRFAYPTAGTICCRPSKSITPPPPDAVRTIGEPIAQKKAKTERKPVNRDFIRTPAIQAEIDRRLKARTDKYEPAMKSKGWLSAIQIGIRVRSTDDTVRAVLKRMIRDGQVENWKKSHRESFYRWISAATKLPKD